MAITAELKQALEARQTLALEEARALMRRILQGDASESELAALLGAMAARGETAEEIAGFALALREAATPLPLSEVERARLVDSCGTGGDGAGTLNISTGAALVAAAAGAWVAKHGNRAVTSRCGSADVLEALGVPVDLSPAQAAACLREHQFCFMLASAHHPGMRAVMPVRRALGVRTIFNLLGPLLNPAGARRQVMGVYSAAALAPVAQAMPFLGVERALVVHGHGNLDELSLSGPSKLVEVSAANGVHQVRHSELEPDSCGLARAPLHTLAGGADAAENATMLLNVFAGERGPKRDVVLLNAGAVLYAAEEAATVREGVQRAAAAVDCGAVLELVAALRGFTVTPTR